MSELEEVVEAALQAVLDPGAYVHRGPDREGNAYGEPINDWQRRALSASLESLIGDKTDATLERLANVFERGRERGRIETVHSMRAEYRKKVITDAADAINYFFENPSAWAYVRATNPELVRRLRAALGEP